MSDIGYDINKEDIERTVRILGILDPSNANANTAINFLVYLKKNSRNADPDKLELFYDQFKKASVVKREEYPTT
ncbi:hypothetical protein HY312_04495 [Candidatus Saccharibacteria bacterium]|nr:hypothetical protein [Candidatus Saccharibacteria bacterium]